MADYIYLLENRLSTPQRQALEVIRQVARHKGLTVFLVGGAVRDLTSGAPVNDLDVAVQGNALKLKKDLQLAGAAISGEYEPGQSLFVRFPGSVRVEIGSTLTVHYPKPGKPVFKPATILEDLRRRDFTANAMALSLNPGSYGLLMDPLNGVADIENRQLRLVSNYGFIEAPVRMIRAARLLSRLGWTLEEKTESRYRTGIQEDYIAALSDFHRGYELEEIVHEEDPLRVMVALETDGWLKVLAPYWTSAKANAAELEKLRDVQTQLQLQGIHPDASSAHFPLLTAKLQSKEVAQLKMSFARQGFVAEIDGLESASKEFAAQLSAKTASSPSQAWKLITSASPEAVLWTAYATKSAALQAKFKSFFTEWPLVRQKIPYALMLEMRITPELPVFAELVEKLFFELMDGHLGIVEELKAFLEPYSPPAPPPPPSMRRARATKKDAKPKGRARKALAAKLEEGDEDVAEVDIDEVEVDVDVDVDDEELIDIPVIVDDEDSGDPLEDDDDDDEEEIDDDVAVKKASAKTAAATAKAKAVKPVPPAPKVVEKAAKPVPPSEKTAAKPTAKLPVKPVKAVAPAKPAKVAAKPVAKSAGVKPASANKPKVAAPAKSVATKPIPAKKILAKKPVPAKKVVAKKAAPVKPVRSAAKPGKSATRPAVKVVAKVKPVAPKKKPAVVAKTKTKPKAKPAPPAKGKKR